MNHINAAKRTLVPRWYKSTNFHVFKWMIAALGGVVMFVQKSE